MDLQTFLGNTLFDLVQLVVPILTAFVIRWIQTKVSNEKLNQYKNLATTFVKAAQQTFGSDMGESKKLQVIEQLSKATGGKLSSEMIGSLLEEAVYAIKQGEQKATPVEQPVVVEPQAEQPVEPQQ